MAECVGLSYNPLVMKLVQPTLAFLCLAACASAQRPVERTVNLPSRPVSLSGDVGAQGATYVYENILDNVFTTTTRPPRAIDDVTLASGQTKFNCVNFGFNINGTTAIDLRVEINFFQTINYGANPGPLNSGPLGTVVVTYLGLLPGQYQSGLVDFSGSLGTVTVADGNLGVELVFRDPNTMALSTRTTVVFAGGGPAIGSSIDMYARDVNGNSVYDAGEGRTFTGGINQANFFLELAYSPSTTTITGNVELQQYEGPAGQMSNLEFRTPSTQTVVASIPITLDGSGNYTATSAPVGVYDLTVKFSNWLRQVIPSVNTASTTVADFSLINGDGDPDNAVNLFDVNGVLSDFGAIGWDQYDMTWNDAVDLFDLNVSLSNFGISGDP